MGVIVVQREKRSGSFGLFLICVLQESLQAIVDGVHVTEDALWREIAWSSRWLFVGLHPDRGSDGVLYISGEAFARRLTPLAGVFFGPQFVNVCDLDWNTKNTVSKTTKRRANHVVCAVPMTQTNHGRTVAMGLRVGFHLATRMKSTRSVAHICMLFTLCPALASIRTSQTLCTPSASV